MTKETNRTPDLEDPDRRQESTRNDLNKQIRDINTNVPGETVDNATGEMPMKSKRLQSRYSGALHF